MQYSKLVVLHRGGSWIFQEGGGAQVGKINLSTNLTKSVNFEY